MIGKFHWGAFRLFVLAALVCLFFGMPTAHGTVYYWIDPSGGNFIHSSNWDPTGIPSTSSDTAIFNLLNSYSVLFPALVTNGRFEVAAGTVRFNMDNFDTYTLDPLFPFNDPAAVIGSTAGPLATLRISSSNWVVNADGMLQIGRDVGSNGRLELGSFGHWTSSFSTRVGVNGAGELVLDNIAKLTNERGVLGYGAASSGTATVDNSQWINTDTLAIGRYGTGTLEIGTLSIGLSRVSNDGDGQIAAFGGSIGDVVVDNAGSWTNNASLYVGGTSAGVGGNGSLTILNGTVSVAADMKVWSTGDVTINDGRCEVTGQLETVAGSALNLAGGELSVGSVTLSPGTFQWTGGTLDVQGDATVELNEGLGTSLTVPSAGTLSVAGALSVGPDFSGTLTVNGGAVTSASGIVGSTEESSVAAIALLQGSGANWAMTGDLVVRGHNNADLLVISGAVLSNHNAFVAATTGTTAEIGIDGANTQWNSSGSVYFGGDMATAGGTGTLEVVAEATMSVGGTLKIWDDFDVDITDSTLAAGSLEVIGALLATGTSTVDVVGGNLIVAGGSLNVAQPGELDVTGATVNVSGGGTLDATITGNAATQVTLQDSGSTWSTTGSLQIAAATMGGGHVGTLALGSDTSVTTTGTVEVLDNSVLALNGGTINAPVILLADNDFEGHGALHGDVYAAGNVIATGNLTLGNPASYNGVQIDGNLVVGSHTVTIHKSGFFNIGLVTDISGGTLNVPGGVAIPVGNSLVAFGTINGRLAAQSGSTIEATGNLSLGDATSPAGFFGDGELITHGHTVTIHDANQAVLGSLSTLGAEGTGGTLVAENGAVVEFGKNVVGFGTVDTPDDPIKPLINNGAIAGNSMDQQITLSGYVKGVGTFDNVDFTGTFSPGLSPAKIQLGSASYSGTLLIELGGTDAGSDFDQLNHSGTAILAGTLEVLLIDSFQPQDEDAFTILAAAEGISDEFDTYILPALDGGLTWSVTYSNTAVMLEVLAAFLEADFDEDGDVDGDDFLAWQGGFGTPTGAEHGEGDADADGDVDGDDFLIWQAQFGSAAGSGTNSAVPEPGALVLLLLASIAASGWRRA